MHAIVQWDLQNYMYGKLAPVCYNSPFHYIHVQPCCKSGFDGEREREREREREGV